MPPTRRVLRRQYLPAGLDLRSSWQRCRLQRLLQPPRFPVVHSPPSGGLSGTVPGQGNNDRCPHPQRVETPPQADDAAATFILGLGELRTAGKPIISSSAGVVTAKDLAVLRVHRDRVLGFRRYFSPEAPVVCGFCLPDGAVKSLAGYVCTSKSSRDKPEYFIRRGSSAYPAQPAGSTVKSLKVIVTAWPFRLIAENMFFARSASFLLMS